MISALQCAPVKSLAQTVKEIRNVAGRGLRQLGPGLPSALAYCITLAKPHNVFSFSFLICKMKD